LAKKNPFQNLKNMIKENVDHVRENVALVFALKPKPHAPPAPPAISPMQMMAKIVSD